MTDYTIDYGESGELENLIKSLPGRSEKIINDYLRDKGREVIKTELTNFTPVSNRRKEHAKYSKPYERYEAFNLGIRIITTERFNYLVFPDEGTGTSRDKSPQFFTIKGGEAAEPQLIDGLTETLTAEINK